MTDERLRNLERAFKESGSPDDELAYLRGLVRSGGSLDWDRYQRLAELDVDAAARYLLARVERGDLEREKLELAAYCSHEPARVALGRESESARWDLSATEWVGAIVSGGMPWAGVGVLAAAEAAYPLWGSFASPNEEEWVHRSLVATTRFAGDPTPECRRSAEEAAEWVEDAIFEATGKASTAQLSAARLALGAAHAILGGNSQQAQDAMERALPLVGEAGLRGSVSVALIRAALG